LDVGILTTDPDEIDNAKIGIDILWRIVVGVGAVPALIAILFRWTIPESGRYTYDVKQDARTALKDTRKVYEHQTAMQSDATEFDEFALEQGGLDRQPGSISLPQLPGTTSMPTASFDGFGRSSLGSDDNDMWAIPDPEDDDDEYNQFSYEELHTYFIKEGNWRYLAGTSLAWLLLDFAFVSHLHRLPTSLISNLLTNPLPNSTASASTTPAQWPNSGPLTPKLMTPPRPPGCSTPPSTTQAQSAKSCSPTRKTPPSQQA
jgi:hypothetical protein